MHHSFSTRLITIAMLVITMMILTSCPPPPNKEENPTGSSPSGEELVISPPSLPTNPDAAPEPPEPPPPDQPATASPQPTGPPEKPPSEKAEIETKVMVDNLGIPWSLAFLPDGSALISERNSGKILQLDSSGKTKEVQSIKVSRPGEGGLLGIAVSPQFATDGLIYAYYSSDNDNRVVRFKLGQDPQPIVTGIPRGAGRHNGGRIAFGPDGLLYIGTGDAGDGGKSSQNRKSLGGKILRVTPDGKPAPNNPFGDLIYSYGHRNVQGLTWDTKGQLYNSELGEGSDDEVNKVEIGKNHGWPKAIGKNGCQGSGIEDCVNPIITFSPAEASPSGATFLTKGLIPQWEGDFFMAGLRGECVWRIRIDADGKVTDKERLYQGKFGRIRLVAQAPDGSLWLLTSNSDKGGGNGGGNRVVRIGPKGVDVQT